MSRLPHRLPHQLADLRPGSPRQRRRCRGGSTRRFPADCSSTSRRIRSICSTSSSARSRARQRRRESGGTLRRRRHRLRRVRIRVGHGTNIWSFNAFGDVDRVEIVGSLRCVSFAAFDNLPVTSKPPRALRPSTFPIPPRPSTAHPDHRRRAHRPRDRALPKHRRVGAPGRRA